MVGDDLFAICLMEGEKLLLSFVPEYQFNAVANSYLDGSIS
jgi:hypothetical protein